MFELRSHPGRRRVPARRFCEHGLYESAGCHLLRGSGLLLLLKISGISIQFSNHGRVESRRRSLGSTDSLIQRCCQLVLFDCDGQMKVFLAGIIQGSLEGSDMHAQDYREKLKKILHDRLPDLTLFDPCEHHPNSIDYDNEKARATFLHHLEIIEESDLVIAYLPSASMGTAIEMWRAYEFRVPIISISPLTTNWTIRLLSDRNFETIDDFQAFISENDIGKIYGPGAAVSRPMKENL